MRERESVCERERVKLRQIRNIVKDNMNRKTDRQKQIQFLNLRVKERKIERHKLTDKIER